MYLPSIRPDLSLSWAWCGPVLSDVCCSTVIRILLWGLKGILTKIEGLLRVGALALRTNKAFTGNAEELSAKRKNYLALSQEDFATKKKVSSTFCHSCTKKISPFIVSSCQVALIFAWLQKSSLQAFYCLFQVCVLRLTYRSALSLLCYLHLHFRKHFA